MYTIKEGVKWNNIIQFFHLYDQFVNEFKQKAKLYDAPEKAGGELLIIKDMLLNPFFKLRDKYILLYQDNNLIGFQCLILDTKNANFRQALFGALYVLPEYRKMITLNNKTTYSVAHLRDFAYEILDNENIDVLYISTHKLLLKNILMYIREGFIPYQKDSRGFVDMVKDRQQPLPKEEIHRLTNSILKEKKITLIDKYYKKYNFNFSKIK